MNAIRDVESKLLYTTASFVRDNGLPGATVGIVHGDALAWWAPVGFADLASRRTADLTTLYRIASITKTFTGTAILQLRDEGKLHLDDPAVRHIPELRAAVSPFGDIETVTIRRMLSHESGLMSEPPGTDWRAAKYEGSIARNLERSSEIGTKIPPNTQQKYSNFAYQLLGEIVTRRSGIPYTEYVRANLLEPLGMRNTIFEPVAPDLRSRCATGYSGRFVSDELELSSTAPTTWAEGGLWSCVEDLARWVSFQFHEDGGERKGPQILKGSTLKEMHTPRYIADEAWTEAYAISWAASRRDSVVWIQHSGGLHGFRSNACFDPKQKVGAIVLLNGVADATALALSLADIARESVLREPPQIEPPIAMPQAYAPLIGIYGDRELGALLRLEWRAGKLTFVDPRAPDWHSTLAPTSDPDVFLIEPGVRESGENAVFRRLPDGRVASVFIAAGTWARLDPVAPR